MDNLDSRSLRFFDCYAQQFAAPGRVRYRLGAMTLEWLSLGEHSFAIEVAARPGGKQASGKEKSKQHHLALRREGQQLVADPPSLEIVAGDVVMWHAADVTVPGFAVHGEGPDGAFGSGALRAGAVYTHAFGVPGDYEWLDARGSHVGGVVKVRPVEGLNKETGGKWMASLRAGTAITIDEGKATPEQVEIVVGQTVFWIVKSGPGITITDARLVRTGAKPELKKAK